MLPLLRHFWEEVREAWAEMLSPGPLLPELFGFLTWKTGLFSPFLSLPLSPSLLPFFFISLPYNECHPLCRALFRALGAKCQGKPTVSLPRGVHPAVLAPSM